VYEPQQIERLAQDSSQRIASNLAIANWIFQFTGRSNPSSG
jgi:hypothetical protein